MMILPKNFISKELLITYMHLIHRYNKEMDKLEPSVTVFHKSELKTLGII